MHCLGAAWRALGGVTPPDPFSGSPRTPTFYPGLPESVPILQILDTIPKGLLFGVNIIGGLGETYQKPSYGREVFWNICEL